jgi:hypothetical protein
MDVDVVITRVDVLLDRRSVALGVGAADDALGNIVLVQRLGCLFEVRRQRQLEEEAAAERAVGPLLQRQLRRRLLVLGPADVELTVGRLSLAAF